MQTNSRREKLLSKYKLHNLMKMIDHKQKKRQERITSLEQAKCVIETTDEGKEAGWNFRANDIVLVEIAIIA